MLTSILFTALVAFAIAGKFLEIEILDLRQTLNRRDQCIKRLETEARERRRF